MSRRSLLQRLISKVTLIWSQNAFRSFVIVNPASAAGAAGRLPAQLDVLAGALRLKM